MSKLKLKHGKEYFSPSQLKKLYISIGQLNAYLERIWGSSAAMDLGTAVHVRLLEPEKFAETYITMDNTEICAEIGGSKPTATKKYKEWLFNFQEENRDKKVISQSDMDIVNRIAENCAITGITDTYFTGGEAEKTIKGVAKGFNEEFDALCIVDYDTDFQSIDLKTTSKPLHKFKFDANELGYDIQARLTNAVNGKEFVFVVVQTVAPYDIGIFTCSDFFMNRGELKINTALANYENYEDKFSTQVLNYEL